MIHIKGHSYHIELLTTKPSYSILLLKPEFTETKSFSVAFVVGSEEARACPVMRHTGKGCPIWIHITVIAVDCR